jgi:hypothetical protein
MAAAAAGAGAARSSAMLAFNLAIFLIFSISKTASAEVVNDPKHHRVIVRYSPTSSRAVQSRHYQSMLLSEGVSLEVDLAADRIAVLSGPADTVLAEAMKLPGVESVEEDITLSAHVG